MPSRQPPTFAARAFGLRWVSDRSLDQFAPDPGDAPADVTVRRVDALSERTGGRPFHNGDLFADGVRFRFGEAVFDIFGGARVEWCSPVDTDVPAAFYGTVAALILVWRGLVPLHGSAVAFDGKAVLIAGEPGAGKSSLCHALVRQGGLLVSDDLSALLPLPRAGTPLLVPGRPAIRLAQPGSAEKRLAAVPMVDQDRPIAFAAMAILLDRPIKAGTAEAAALLTRQLFRPLWMRTLPFRRERTMTILNAAPRLAIFAAPHVADRPDLSADDKALMVIDRLRALGVMPS